MSFNLGFRTAATSLRIAKHSFSKLTQNALRIRSGKGLRNLSCAVADKLIASSEIPLIFPREDFILQLFRWAKSEVEPHGLYSFGAPINIEPILKTPDDEDDGLWGFNAYILRDGETACQVVVRMDREKVEKYEFVGIGEDGFPVDEGKVTLIDGKELEIWKVGDYKIDEDTRTVVRNFCKALSEAIDAYASFGSCFADDAT